MGGNLIFESHLGDLWCSSTSYSLFQLPLINPALVHRVVVEVGAMAGVVRTSHGVVELELLHEAIIRLCERATFPDLCQGGGRG